ncbi:DUF397 domain-containing protein [Streptomyces chrestomyceticus]|uniref:DUF397 domain-containing protein n=1 Tax=Streptomyces chrestomyceticus TaxID=68185 RepID=UPI0027DB9AD5|nr:DUF397 domain-containing protein [Streptomyces chrestomyceticus]
MWRKSSYSGSDADSCVEITYGPGAVLVRDSKAADGPQLAVPVHAWEAFICFAAASGA